MTFVTKTIFLYQALTLYSSPVASHSSGFRFLPSSIPVNDCLINSVKNHKQEANTLLTILTFEIMPSKLSATTWIHEYGDMLFRYALPRVNDEDTAKDLVQETFLAAWRNRENFKGEISEKNWLYTILKNKIIDHFRKASTRLTDRLPGQANEEAYFDENLHWTKAASPNDWSVNADDAVNRKEFHDVLKKCKSKLKETQDMVFTMKYQEDMDSEEICKVLNITPSNYWVLIHRAKLQLRVCIEKNWFLK